MILEEGDLRFSFDGALDAIQFDDAKHGLSHCMKAVDFIVEFEKYFLFVEVKDPELPSELVATTSPRIVKAREQAVADFLNEFQAGELRKQLVTKFRDSFIYRWAEDRMEKPIHYLVLLELPSVDATLLGPELTRLRGAIPYSSTGAPCSRWKNSIAGECQIHSLRSWNSELSWPVVRISEAGE